MHLPLWRPSLCRTDRLGLLWRRRNWSYEDLVEQELAAILASASSSVDNDRGPDADDADGGGSS